MPKILLWKVKVIFLLFITCGLIFLLNILDITGIDLGRVRSYFPKLNLGLDLVGGAHFTLSPDISRFLEEKYTKIASEIEAQKLGIVTNIGANGITIARKAVTLESGIKKIDENLQYEGKNDLVSFPASYMESLISELVQQSIHVIRNRIDGMGTREINLYRNSFDSIVLQIPRATDGSSVQSLLGHTAKLDFYLTSPFYGQILDKNIKIDKAKYKILEFKNKDSNTPVTYYVVEKNPVLSGEDLSDARLSFDSIKPQIAISFNSKGSGDFARITSKNTGRNLAIVVDDKVLCAPSINEPILGGRAVISGHFTPEEMKELTISLKSGALPAKILVLEEKNIESSLGREAIKSSFIAVSLGLFAVLLFMGIYYKKMGFVAIFGLLMNLFLTITLFAIFDITLTMPGIAGLLLTLGMAVDVNVLIYEKMREFNVEKTPKLALIENGFSGAMSSIIDANFTTLLASVALLLFGTVFVKGFAVAITIGIVFSFFTAVFITRVLAEYIARCNTSNKNFV